MAVLAWIIYGQTDGKCEMGAGEEGVVHQHTATECEKTHIHPQNKGRRWWGDFYVGLVESAIWLQFTVHNFPIHVQTASNEVTITSWHTNTSQELLLLRQTIEL